MKTNLLFLSSALVASTLLLAACGGGGTDVATVAPTNTAKSYYLEIGDIKGTVEVRTNADANYAPAKTGQRLHEGAQIRSGADGDVVLYRDRLSMALVGHDTEVLVKTLQGTPAVPVTQLLLSGGKIFIERVKKPIPAGFVFAATTSDGTTGGLYGPDVVANKSGPNASTKMQANALPPPEILPPSVGLIDALNGSRGGGPLPKSMRSSQVTCVVGPCSVAKSGEKPASLNTNDFVDVKDSQPLPPPIKVPPEQKDQFVTLANEACGCNLSFEDIANGKLAEKETVPDDVKDEEQPE